MKTKINDVTLQQTSEFVYLGGKISDAATSDADIDRRIGLATAYRRFKESGERVEVQGYQ